MKWVTWENVGVDRMGCVWLIQRHIDREAEFVFVPSGQPALPPDAEAFDIPGVRLSHYRGHSSFHTILKEYELDDAVLLKVARIVDEADVLQETLVEPAAAGLDLICRGIRLTSPDDHTALARGALVFDALYAQCAADAGER
jgi:hypothetical protein